MTGLAAVSRELAAHRVPRRAGPLRRWLAHDRAAHTLTAMAVGELAVDKLPGIPDRIGPGPLGGRSAIGALLGALAVDRHPILGGLVGAAAATAAAYGGWFLRREAGRATLLPDTVIALVEDAVAVAGARELADRL